MIRILITVIITFKINLLYSQKVFDTHLHGRENHKEHLGALINSGVYKVAISGSWNHQTRYKSTDEIVVLKGLMLACHEGRIPYSEEPCFEDQQDFPDPVWVENQIVNDEIHFIGEVLGQYYGISPSDKRFFPYYALAEKYNIPVGIHTGSAGPGHGAPNFKESLGSPHLMKGLLQKFPKLRVWIMHAGVPFLDEAVDIMSKFQNVYVDISVVSNPEIFTTSEFEEIMNRLIKAGHEDRVMFGSDNGDIAQCIKRVKSLEFLTANQTEKILYKNAEKFFAKEN